MADIAAPCLLLCQSSNYFKMLFSSFTPAVEEEVLTPLTLSSPLMTYGNTDSCYSLTTHTLIQTRTITDGYRRLGRLYGRRPVIEIYDGLPLCNRLPCLVMLRQLHIRSIRRSTLCLKKCTNFDVIKKSV